MKEVRPIRKIKGLFKIAEVEGNEKVVGMREVGGKIFVATSKGVYFFYIPIILNKL
jgi:hypothetical protein